MDRCKKHDRSCLYFKYCRFQIKVYCNNKHRDTFYAQQSSLGSAMMVPTLGYTLFIHTDSEVAGSFLPLVTLRFVCVKY